MKHLEYSGDQTEINKRNFRNFADDLRLFRKQLRLFDYQSTDECISRAWQEHSEAFDSVWLRPYNEPIENVQVLLFYMRQRMNDS